MQPAHAATSPAAGWFADPHAPNFVRWWDGFQWTHHVQPAAPAAPAPAHALAPVAAVAPGAAVGGFAATPGIAAHHAYAPQQAAAPGIAAHNAYAPQQSAAHAVAPTATLAGMPSADGGSLMDENPRSIAAITIAFIYLALAITTGFVIAGIWPAFLTYRAFERREKLAPVAALAAVAAIAFAVTHWQTR
ncbi:MAG: DUF2510 domain-containing protein [Solirubrobacteraceae bacterium]|nr:DUF2510 domain-containing protein [Solirubrobacteraceae bacterium]